MDHTLSVLCSATLTVIFFSYKQGGQCLHLFVSFLLTIKYHVHGRPTTQQQHSAPAPTQAGYAIPNLVKSGPAGLQKPNLVQP